MSTPRVHMTELEEQLAGPDGAAVRGACIERLRLAQESAHARMASPLPRGEHAQLSKTRDALRAAIETLRSWPVPDSASGNSAASGFRAIPTHAERQPKG